MPGLDEILSELSAPADIGAMAGDAMAMALAEQQQAEAQAAFDADLARRKLELHNHLRQWLGKAMMHRRANYEHKWDRWRRNANSIYDPAKAARKENWQSKMFVPLTLQNKEIIKSNLYRTLVAGLPYSIAPYPSGDHDQAQSIKDLVLREMRRSQFELAANDVIDDITIYGTGFFKRAYVTERQKRRVRVPVLDTSDQAMIGAEAGQPPPVIGYESQIQERETYRGIKAWAVSIWDLFLEEGWSDVKTAKLAHRRRVTYQEIVDGVRAGYYFPEAAQALRDIDEDASQPPPDRQGQASDRGLSAISTPKTDYQRNHTVYEFYGPLPQKWVYCRPEDQHLITDPDELVPAKCVFNATALCSVDENEEYDGTTPFEASTYIHRPGEGYGMGIGEMLEQIQDDQNETTNQRKDNVAIILNRMGVILESAIVSRADLVSKPGGFTRIKKGAVDDVRKAMMWSDTPDVTQSSYAETANNERFSQELTAATRFSAGGGGGARDLTQTKGGMEIIEANSNERFTYYAMVIELMFMAQTLRSFYTLIYANIQPQDVLNVLGPERAMSFRLMTPEEVDQDYAWIPEGVFRAMRQPLRISQMQAFRDQYAGAPFFDDFAMASTIAKAIELPNQDKILQPIRDPLTGKVIPFQMMQNIMLAQGADPGAGPGKAVAADTKPRINDKKASKNAPTESK